MYKVVSIFTDLKDNNHRYKVGEEYPRSGYEPTKERIEYLLSNKTRRKSPVIEEVIVEEKAVEPKKKRTAKKKQ